MLARDFARDEPNVTRASAPWQPRRNILVQTISSVSLERLVYEQNRASLKRSNAPCSMASNGSSAMEDIVPQGSGEQTGGADETEQGANLARGPLSQSSDVTPANDVIEAFPATGFITELELEFDRIEHLLEENLLRAVLKYLRQRGTETRSDEAAERLTAAISVRRLKLEVRDSHGALLGSTSYVDYEKHGNQARFHRQRLRFFLHTTDHKSSHPLVHVHIIGRATPLKRYSSYVLQVEGAATAGAEYSHHGNRVLGNAAVREQYFASLPVDDSAALAPVPFPRTLLQASSNRISKLEVNHRENAAELANAETAGGTESRSQLHGASRHHTTHRMRLHLGHCHISLRTLLECPDESIHCVVHGAGRYTRLFIRCRVTPLPFCSISLPARLPNFPYGSYSFRIHVHDVSILQASQNKWVSMNPVAYVYALGETQHTQVCRWSFTAIFDRMLFFSKTMGQEEIQDEIITIAVWNWNFWRTSQLIGSYSFDFLHLWNQKDHSIHWKWLPLTTTSGERSELVGYIRISAVVYGPGIMPVNERATNSLAVLAPEGRAPRLLKNLVVQRPTLSMESWRLHIAILGIELAPSWEAGVHTSSNAAKDLRPRSGHLDMPAMDTEKLGRALHRTGEHTMSSQKRIYFEILFPSGTKRASVTSDVVSVPLAQESKLSMGFCLPISLTSDGEANFEDIILRIRESPNKRAIAEIHLSLSYLLQRGCTATILFHDAAQLNHLGEAHSHHHGPSNLEAHEQSLLKSMETRAHEYFHLWLQWLENWLRKKPDGHTRERRVLEMRPRYIQLYESPTKYVGRVLIAARMWPYSAHCKTVPLWYHRLNWDDEFTATQRAPHRLKYILCARLQQITELDVPDSSYVKAHLTIGHRWIATTDDSTVKDHVARMGPFIAVHPLEAVTKNGVTNIELELEQDWDNVPDIFLHLYHRDDPNAPEKRFSLLRLPASLLHALPRDNLCRSWLLDKPNDEGSRSSSLAGTAYLYICLRHAETKEPISSEEARHSADTWRAAGTGVHSHQLSEPAAAQEYWVDCNIIRCRNLPALDPTGFSDPFLVVRFGSARTFGTRLCHQTCDPSFFERLCVGPVHLHHNEVLPPVSVKVFDWDADPETFDPRKLEKAQYLCRVDVDLKGLTSTEPSWFDMFISNPVVPHGSMLASFSLRKATVEVPRWPLTGSVEESSPNVAQYHATTRLVQVRNHEAQAPEARHARAPAYAGMPTWILPRACEANACQANRYLLVSLLSVHHLGLHEFGLDPCAESLTLRLYLNIRDGTYRSAPFRVTDGTIYSADRNTMIDTILMRLPSSLDNLTSLHIILESTDGGKFFASANIPPEEWAEKHLLTGGLQQYGLESLESAMRTRNAKRKRGKPAEHTKPTPTPPDAERDRKLVDLATVRRRLHEHWHHDIRGSALALWVALVNYLVETAPEFALRFGMEEMEFPPSLLTPWLLRFFRLVHHRGLVAALEHYERASHFEHHEEHGLSDGSPSHEHQKIAPQHIHEELEKHLRSCAIFSETVLRHGLTRYRRHGVHLFSKMHRHQNTESKPTLAPRTRSESTPMAMLRMWFSRHKQNTKAAQQQAPSTAHASSLSTEPTPETGARASMNNDSSKERQSEASSKGRQSSQGLARRLLSAETRVPQLTTVAAERTSMASLKSNWIPKLRRRRRMRTRRHEAEDRLSLLFHESKRYQDPVPVGKLALDLRLLEADPDMTAEDAGTSASPLRIERVQDVQQFQAEYHRRLRDRFQPRMDVVVRLHVFNARGLRVPSGDPNIYLKIELNRGEQTQSTKRSTVRHSLHPDLFQSFEFTGVRLPGSSLVIRVKHFSGPDFEVPNAAVLLPRYENWTLGPFVHQAMSKDLRIDLVRTRVGHGMLLGETEIDLDQRWYSENDSFSRLEPPIETRRLFVPNRVIHRGEITLRLELLSAAEAATRPFRPLAPPAPRQYELRLVIWRVMGCKKEGTEQSNQNLAASDAYGSTDIDSGGVAPRTNFGTGLNASADATVPLQDLEVRAQLGNDISSEMRTSVVHNCDDGGANFNYRLIWRPLHWPNPDLVPRLRLHVWDVRKPTGFPLIGQLAPSEPELLATVTLDLSSIFEEARHSHERIHRPRQWILMHRVGTASAATVPRIAVSLDLLSKEQAMQHPEGSQVGQSGLPEPLQPVPFSAFAPQRYVRYRIARLWQDGFWYAVQMALLTPGGIALLKILASIPLLLYLFAAVAGTLLVLRMRRVERELEFV